MVAYFLNQKIAWKDESRLSRFVNWAEIYGSKYIGQNMNHKMKEKYTLQESEKVGMLSFFSDINFTSIQKAYTEF